MDIVKDTPLGSVKLCAKLLVPPTQHSATQQHGKPVLHGAEFALVVAQPKGALQLLEPATGATIDCWETHSYYPDGPARELPRGRNGLPGASQPNCLLRCFTNDHSPHREGFSSSFKTNPGRVIPRPLSGNSCRAAVFTSRWAPLLLTQILGPAPVRNTTWVRAF